jgi:hypothetical protein
MFTQPVNEYVARILDEMNRQASNTME